MALARVKVVNPGDTILSADWNNEFNNVLNNPITLISPTTGAINFQTSVAHTNLVPSAITASSGTAGQALVVSTGLTSIWGAPSAVPSLSIVRGLLGTVTSSQTATLQADQYVLQTTATTPGFFALASTAPFTVNVGTAGPAANGRDVAAAFSSTFVHVYAITTGLNSTTPAGIASTTPPIAGPVLPTSYSAWGYLGTFPYSSASTTFTAGQRVRGAYVDYEGVQNALNAGSATVETATTLGSLIPSVALEWRGQAQRVGVTADAGGSAVFTCDIRAITGTNLVRYNVASGHPANASAYQQSGNFTLPNVGQQFFYLFTITNGSAAQLTVDVLGYSVPNGGE